jgi:hypothetical protein
MIPAAEIININDAKWLNIYTKCRENNFKKPSRNMLAHIEKNGGDLHYHTQFQSQNSELGNSFSICILHSGWTLSQK